MTNKLRRLHIGGEVWQYRLGRRWIVILAPSGAKHLTDASQVTGRSWGVFERGQRKATLDGVIAPRHVKSYIESQILTRRVEFPRQDFKLEDMPSLDFGWADNLPGVQKALREHRKHKGG